jgi:hypothetical protein
LDAVTRQSTHRPVEVTYCIQASPPEAGSSPAAAPRAPSKTDLPPPSVLVRKQVTLDEPNNHNTWADVVCTGVGSLRLLVIESTKPDDAAASHSSADAGEDAELRPAAAECQWPQRVRLTLRWADEKQPPLDRTLQLN